MDHTVKAPENRAGRLGHYLARLALTTAAHHRKMLFLLDFTFLFFLDPKHLTP